MKADKKMKLQSTLTTLTFFITGSLLITGCALAGHPSGFLLFQNPPEPEDLSRLKVEFKQSAAIQQNAPGRPYYEINTTRGHGQLPNSPIVHTYHLVGVLSPLVMALPEAFRWNIPQSIRNEIIRREIQNLDILFTPQQEVRGNDVSLKAAYWMFPNRPALAQIHGAPPQFQKTVQLGIFEPDHPIGDQVQVDRLQTFEVSLHDGRVSPNTGHLNLEQTPEGSFSFYSLAFFQEQKRAAVTLHWILTQEDRETLTRLIAETIASENSTLEGLAHRLNEPTSPFYETSPLRKLNDLLAH